MQRSTRPRCSLVACLSAGLCTALVCSGCQSSAQSVHRRAPTVVLHLATIDTLNSNGQLVAPTTFVTALRRLSAGRLTARVQKQYEDGEVAAETDIVKAIAAGKLDGGWPSTRAFARAGIRGLEPIEAPMALTSYPAEKALVGGPGSRRLLSTLRGSGVVGLGLSVGPLRRPWSVTRPLVEPARWHGLTFRSYNSPVQTDTIRALGGRPVPASFDFPDLVNQGLLRGVELDAAQFNVGSDGEILSAGVANVVLWPRVLVLALSRKRFESLTSHQRNWVIRAAHEAVDASTTFRYDDSRQAAASCAAGVRFATSSPSQVASLRRAVRPVNDALARDPATSRSMAVVRRVARRFPQTDVIRVPASCRR